MNVVKEKAQLVDSVIDLPCTDEKLIDSLMNNNIHVFEGVFDKSLCQSVIEQTISWGKEHAAHEPGVTTDPSRIDNWHRYDFDVPPIIQSSF